jgi:hypothetical protein
VERPLLELVDHHDDIAGANDHFGSLLFDTAGRLCVHAGSRTWLYTGSLLDGRWVSFARELDLDTLACGEKRLCLVAHDDDDWATIHLVVRVGDSLLVAFYSTGATMRAAVAEAPDGPFRAVPGFAVGATEPWERDTTVESDGGFHLVSEDEREVVGWVLYDTLAADTGGHNGWALVRVGKASRDVSFVRKHPANPVGLLLPGRLAARTGGNLASDLRIQGMRALFYLSKPDAVTYRFAVALSRNPLFDPIAANVEFDGVLGREQVVEKFEAFGWKGLLHLMYEVGPPGERLWRTGLRRYRITAAAGTNPAWASVR